MTCLAIVPARSGSVELPRKNLRTIHGKTLIWWVAECIKQVPEIDAAVLSSDHEAILGEAEMCGLEPIWRPPELSTGMVGDAKVLTHALLVAEAEHGLEYDVIVMLQPTSPTRTPAHVSQAIKKLIDERLDAVWTISPVNKKYHPLKQLVLSDCDELDFYNEIGNMVIFRQELRQTYRRNGIAYVMTRETLLDGAIHGINWGAVVLGEDHISIDTEEDLEKCGRLLSQTLVL